MEVFFALFFIRHFPEQKDCQVIPSPTFVRPELRFLLFVWDGMTNQFFGSSPVLNGKILLVGCLLNYVFLHSADRNI